LGAKPASGLVCVGIINGNRVVEVVKVVKVIKVKVKNNNKAVKEINAKNIQTL
jgi:hypothetical protein